jgi:hypothetical protein
MVRSMVVVGLTAVAGGVAWVATCLSLASHPRGCVGDECLTRPMREWSTTSTVLAALAFVLVVASGAGLLSIVWRRAGLGGLGRAAIAAGCLAVGLLLSGGLAAWLAPAWSEDMMPAFVVPGVILTAVAIALTAWVVLRSRLLPRWLAAVLVLCAVVMLGANEQTDSILLAAPFGLAWAVAGLVLIRGASRTAATQHAGQATR